jgi:hypothetical protein
MSTTVGEIVTANDDVDKNMNIKNARILDVRILDVSVFIFQKKLSYYDSVIKESACL